MCLFLGDSGIIDTKDKNQMFTAVCCFGDVCATNGKNNSDHNNTTELSEIFKNALATALRYFLSKNEIDWV